MLTPAAFLLLLLNPFVYNFGSYSIGPLRKRHFLSYCPCYRFVVFLVVSVSEVTTLICLADSVALKSRLSQRDHDLKKFKESSKVKLLAPHTSGPRDVPRCGALSLLQKDAALQGEIQQKPLLG